MRLEGKERGGLDKFKSFHPDNICMTQPSSKSRSSSSSFAYKLCPQMNFDVRSRACNEV